MSEGGKLRVVRCPKCEKHLLELPDYAVYRCGGCDATLHTGRQTPVTAEVSLDGEMVRILENSESCSEKLAVGLNGNLETDRDSDAVEFKGKERVLPERTVNSDGGSSSRTDAGEVFCDRGNRYRRTLKPPIAPNVDGLIRTNADEKKEAQMENASAFRISQQMPDWRATERGGPYRRTPRTVSEGVRFSPYPEEGPSSYHSSFAYEYGEPIKQPNADGSRRVEHLEQDRAKLLRKLDELRDQLSRSCDISEELKDRAPPANARTAPLSSGDRRNAWFAEGSAISDGPSSQVFPPDNKRPSYFSNERVPLMNRHDMAVQNSYSPMHLEDENLGYGDLFQPQMLRRKPRGTCQYSQRLSNGYLSGHYVGIDHDPFFPYQQSAFCSQPPCSCLHCYNKHWQVPPQVPSTNVFCNRQLPNSGTNQMFYHTNGPGILGTGSYNRRGADAPLRSLEAQLPVSRQSILEPDMGGFRRSCLQRPVLSKANSHRSYLPIAGGAPFMTCYNCFELLRLPKNLLSLEKSQHNLRCGACSKVVSFALDGKRLLISFPAQTKNQELDVDDDSGDVVRRGLYSQLDQGTLDSSYSGDEDNTGYNNQSPDTKPISSSALPLSCNNEVGKECTLNLSDSEKMQGLSSSSSSLEDDESPDGMASERKMTRSMELSLKADATSTKSGVPLREHFGSSPNHQGVSKFQRGSRSKRSDQATKGTSRQNSLKDASVATEMDCPFNECPNSDITQDFEDPNKEEDRPRVSKGGESFFAGLIKKSFKDFGRSNQLQENGKVNVYINGQPIPDRLLKKAEKQAGPIEPGQYWYDYRAGFWGVMGHECLGIIPPFVEEFNHPMPKNCSGGDTGVFVNGRELHQKDLDLLAGRGLPVTREKSYIVEISGRVLDETSGEELDCLGKLAPTRNQQSCWTR